MPRVPAEQVIERLTALLRDVGVEQPQARRLAELHAQASADGVYSHGVHRVPHLLESIRRGLTRHFDREPTRVAAFGALERYDGHRGIGPLHGEWCMDRAMALAQAHGVGAVALRHTNHWGRPGNFGWRAAERGYLAICWTNTPATTPPWGGDQLAIGNNPIVFACPGPDGRHLVLDMALNQYSFGRLGTHKAAGEPLPVVGGTDRHGQPTTDAAAILDGGRPWPIGFWKGTGLALLLDAFAAILADGPDTAELTRPGRDTAAADSGVCQVYLAFAPQHLGGRPAAQRVGELVAFLAQRNPEARYPGQAALAERRRSDVQGIWIRDDVWQALGA